MAGILDRLDAHLDELFKGWNFLTTLLALTLLVYMIWPLITAVDPDTHPLLLSRQANISQVRQEGESAVYRSLETPHGYPLKTGLNVKEPGAAKWASGKDGDLRDIWRQAAAGSVNENGERSGAVGKILTVLGITNIVEHNVGSISKEINVIGNHIREHGGANIAVYLPNSVEFLTTVFAGAFYGFTPILIPYDLPSEVVIKLLQLAKADFLITAAGSITFADVHKQCKDIRRMLLVVEQSSREMDWSEGSANESVWHDLVAKSSDTPSELPSNKPNEALSGLTSVWLSQNPEQGEIVTFTQKNIVAAVAAQLSALPARHRMGLNDLFLPAESLTTIYTLVQTLAALFSNASVALNSVAGFDVELPLAATGIAPTIIAASAESASKLHTATKSTITSSAKRWALRTQTQALKTGVMPSASLLTRFNTPKVATIGNVSGKLRLMYIYERTHAGTPPLSSVELSDLRAFTGARIIYALGSAKVAGTVAQTNFYDYRVQDSEDGPRHAHFGVPVSAVEAIVVDKDEHKTVEGGDIKGEIVVKGPAVLDGEANLGVLGTFRDDGTLAYLED